MGSELNQLRRLTAEMYQQTSRFPRTAQHAQASASHEAVRRAPVQRLAPAEQNARMRTIQGEIIQHLLAQ
jgi:hypothetical protein